MSRFENPPYQLLASDGYNSDFFGTAVAISGNFALAGASHHNHIVPDSGAAYPFEGRPDGNWVGIVKLRARRLSDRVSLSSRINLILVDVARWCAVPVPSRKNALDRGTGTRTMGLSARALPIIEAD